MSVNTVLGPRYIPYVTNKGTKDVGTIIITLGESKFQDFDDGDRLEWKTGWVDVDFDGKSHRLTAEGADDIQLIYFLMDRAGVWVTTAAKRRGINLFDYRTDPVEGSMDIFDC